jgi:enoyl-CoA hydratase
LHRRWIDQSFGKGTVEEIVKSLSAHDDDGARAALQELLKQSPTSLKVTLQALRRARTMSSLEECLDQEFRLVCRCLESHDFYEGIRAAVIDKDRSPQWKPGSLEAVSDQAVECYFSLLGDQELRLTA